MSSIYLDYQPINQRKPIVVHYVNHFIVHRWWVLIVILATVFTDWHITAAIRWTLNLIVLLCGNTCVNMSKGRSQQSDLLLLTYIKTECEDCYLSNTVLHSLTQNSTIAFNIKFSCDSAKVHLSYWLWCRWTRLMLIESSVYGHKLDRLLLWK